MVRQAAARPRISDLSQKSEASVKIAHPYLPQIAKTSLAESWLSEEAMRCLKSSKRTYETFGNAAKTKALKVIIST
jgi:hypothetical protein